MMRSSVSLPSLLTESKLFSSPLELETAKNELKTRIQDEGKSQSQEKKMSRALIHFQDKGEGFTSFRSLNTSKIEDIMNSMRNMRSSSTNIGRSIKAEILFNKHQYAKITDYCENRKITQRENAINRLAKLEPLPMKKEVKMTDRNKKKVKMAIGLKTEVNYEIYQNNRLAWKPFIDFDAMNVIVKDRVYFIGGRKPFPLCFYDRTQDKWGQLNIIENLKPFGQSQGTVVSKDEIAFFGGSKFFFMGEPQTTNNLTIVNIKSLQAEIKTFDQQMVTPRCFHAQCLYGQYLLISGGIDNKNKLLNKFTAYHLEKKYWVQLTIAKMHDKLKQGFAKHKMMPILLPRKKYNIYEEEPIIATDNERSQISHEGIYLFGGEDPNVELSNKIYILTVGKPSIEVYQPVIKGTPPTPRKNFDWTRIREFLFIQGGRNDERRPWALNSLVCLNLQTMNWISIKGQKPSYRFSHSLLAGQNEIVIIGGKNMQGLTKEIFPIKFSQIIEYV